MGPEPERPELAIPGACHIRQINRGGCFCPSSGHQSVAGRPRSYGPGRIAARGSKAASICHGSFAMKAPARAIRQGNVPVWAMRRGSPPGRIQRGLRRARHPRPAVYFFFAGALVAGVFAAGAAFSPVTSAGLSERSIEATPTTACAASAPFSRKC